MTPAPTLPEAVAVVAAAGVERSDGGGGEPAAVRALLRVVVPDEVRPHAPADQLLLPRAERRPRVDLQSHPESIFGSLRTRGSFFLLLACSMAG